MGVTDDAKEEEVVVAKRTLKGEECDFPLLQEMDFAWSCIREDEWVTGDAVTDDVDNVVPMRMIGTTAHGSKKRKNNLTEGENE
jgi:hypothetical protein